MARTFSTSPDRGPKAKRLSAWRTRLFSSICWGALLDVAAFLDGLSPAMSQPAEVNSERASTTNNNLRVSGMNQLQTYPGKRILTLNRRKVAGLQGKPWAKLTADFRGLKRSKRARGWPVVAARKPGGQCPWAKSSTGCQRPEMAVWSAPPLTPRD